MALPSVDPSSLPPLPVTPINMPPPSSGGMFGGGKVQVNLNNALAGYLAGRFPQYASAFLEPMSQRNMLERQSQLAMLKDNLEYQRQMQLAQYERQNPAPGEQERMLDLWNTLPDSDPRKAMLGSMLQHPVAMDVTNPDGSVTRQYVYPGTIPQQSAAPKPLTDADIDRLTGGQTPPASGGFR